MTPTTRQLSSWGRLQHDEHRVVRLQEASTAAAAVRTAPLPAIAFGAGRSYGDQALNDGGTVWWSRGLDKFIEFDAGLGILRCEAGVTLQDILAVALPRGWFLPVTPGTQFATIGGAVANDVHGKNHHHAGTLGEHVLGLTLLRTDGQVIRCGPALARDWFRATVAGMGLTGVVLDVSLQLRRVAGPWIDTETLAFETLDDFFALSAAAADAWDYSVAWVDCSKAAGDRVRGALFCGSHAQETAPLAPPKARSAARLPAARWVTPAGTRVFNELYFRRAKARQGRSRQSYLSFFYPLDGVLEWNRIYGPRGFYQYQCVVPAAVQKDAVAALLREVAGFGSGSFLSVLKTFGPRPALGMLSFPMPGTTLALDFPNEGDRTARLFDRLNAIVDNAGGRLYPAKDAMMPAAMFRRGYPGLDEFDRFRDPGISSAMSRRLLGR